MRAVDRYNRLLARNPPRNLRFAAWHAKAEQGLRAGQYPDALAHANTGLTEVTQARAAEGDLPAPEQALAQQLARVRALAEAQVGDPQQALQWLAALPGEIAQDGERLIATAVARDRSGDRPGALLAFAQYRSVTADASPEAAFAEEQMRALWSGLEPGVLETVAHTVAGTPAAACLRARAGHPLEPQSPGWVQQCRPSITKVGFLLPRTGRFAGLADLHLAAAAAGLKVLARGAEIEAVWADAGGTAEQVGRAATDLVRAGVDVVIGPVGPGNPEAAATAATAAGGKPRMVVPGEAAAGVGVAPTLEARVAALVGYAVGSGRREFIVLAPDNGYGKRAVQGIQRTLQESKSKPPKVLYYLDDMTSFAKLVAPVLSDLSARGTNVALVIPDQLARTELLIRQLVRAGMTVDRGNTRGVVVLTTAEGWTAAAIGPGHEVLDGVWAAPVAWPTADGDGFAEAYTALEGHAPGDQAWLLWRAMAAAWDGGPVTSPQAAVLRVERGRLVPSPASIELRPRETQR